ncbi:NfeD family protein [Derxia lacustris]|uniref:NfeD family protein n=1 Tax=Derxia lacustris TaxID=764842 RepID=UPI000A171F19|nr:NfeD family protein [Derxia lacustris]
MQATSWGLVALGLMALEMAVGTFYVLMLALGAGAAALVALTGAGTVVQSLVAAAVASSAVLLLRRRRARSGRGATDLGLDLGQPVEVAAWNAGLARVHYRGSEWEAELAHGEPAAAGPHHIVAVRGARLVLGPGPAPRG